MHEQRTTNMHRCQCMKFSRIISGCPAGARKNGAGKSTLLSLVCADNPQSYACDITLFDNPRGSGESIWDIKKHIGYVSPGMAPK